MFGKKLVLFLVLGLFLFPVALGQTIVTLDNIKNIISYSEEAEFRLNITNNDKIEHTYNVYSPTPDIAWSIDPKPLTNRAMKIQPGVTKSTIVGVRTLKDVNEGNYLLPLVIASDNGEKQRLTIRVYVGEISSGTYLPTLRVTTDMAEKINVSEPQTIRATVENLNRLNFTDLTVRIKSEMEGFSQRQEINLGPFEEKVLEFSILPNSYQQPKDYLLYFTFEHNSELIKIVEKKVTVIERTPVFKHEPFIQERFLKTSYDLKVTNTGNIENTQTVFFAAGPIQRLFTSAEEKPIIQTKDEEKGLSWKVNLKPDASRIIHFETSYRLPFALLLLLLILAITAAIMKSPLELTKSAKNILVREGAVSGMKVILHVRNTSKKNIRDVEVVDIIPHIAEITKEIEEGSISPEKITRDTEGVIVKWKISELEGYEERIISYHIASRLNIIGTFRLPRAKVYFKSMRRKIRVAFSNILRINPNS